MNGRRSEEKKEEKVKLTEEQVYFNELQENLDKMQKNALDNGMQGIANEIGILKQQLQKISNSIEDKEKNPFIEASAALMKCEKELGKIEKVYMADYSKNIPANKMQVMAQMQVNLNRLAQTALQYSQLPHRLPLTGMIGDLTMKKNALDEKNEQSRGNHFLNFFFKEKKTPAASNAMGSLIAMLKNEQKKSSFTYEEVTTMLMKYNEHMKKLEENLPKESPAPKAVQDQYKNLIKLTDTLLPKEEKPARKNR